MMTFEKIPVKKITIANGTDPRGQMVLAVMTATETVKIFVIPGRMLIVEAVTVHGKTVKEMPIGPLGWEYVIDEGAPNG